MESVSVIKVGGKIAEDVAVLNAFLHDLGSVTGPKVLVHGGGWRLCRVGGGLRGSRRRDGTAGQAASPCCRPADRRRQLSAQRAR